MTFPFMIQPIFPIIQILDDIGVTDASRAVSLQALPAASRPLPERSEEQEAVDLALKLLELRWICCMSFSLLYIYIYLGYLGHRQKRHLISFDII